MLWRDLANLIFISVMGRFWGPDKSLFLFIYLFILYLFLFL